MVSVSHLAPKIKPGILEILTALGTIIKISSEFGKCNGKEVIEREEESCMSHFGVLRAQFLLFIFAI